MCYYFLYVLMHKYKNQTKADSTTIDDNTFYNVGEINLIISEESKSSTYCNICIINEKAYSYYSISLTYYKTNMPCGKECNNTLTYNISRYIKHTNVLVYETDINIIARYLAYRDSKRLHI